MDPDRLARTARLADDAMQRARAQLTDAIRAASAAGMSQREIARAVGRSQPEVNRLLRFHGTSPGGLALRRARREVLAILDGAHMANPRVFGSVARGTDSGVSDVDLLVTPTEPIGLMGLARVEHQLSEVVGREVDLVLDDSIRADLQASIARSAVPL